MASSKFKDYKCECVYCDPKLEMHFSTTIEAMLKHCRTAHGVEEQTAEKYFWKSNITIDDLSAAHLAQIFEKLPRQERLKIERVCKKWQNVGKNLSWANYKVFDNLKYHNWPEKRFMEIKPFFERCGRHLRHLTLRTWSPQAVLAFIRMAPNVQHLRLSEETLNDDFLQELAKIVPGLKSLDLTIPRRFDENTSPDYAVGLIECFKAMKDLEYLSIYHHHRYDKGILFNLYSFVQFPPNLKYLDLTRVSNAAQILSWVAKECRHLKGLSLSWGVKENTLQAISQLKSLTYLEMRKITVPCDIGYVLEALSELRALSMSNLDEKMISEIAQHCKKLEHLRIDKVSPETHGSLMRLATLPNLCSLDIWSDNYPKEQTTELINRLIANGKIQYIRMATAKKDSLEPDVLFEVLRRYKNIQSIGLEFGRINRDLYSKICQVVDEIDEEQRQQRELPGMTHPIVEVECNSGLSEFVPYEYKWLKFTNGGGIWKMSLNKWKYGSLSAGKPEWGR